MEKLSVIVPCYNEQETINIFYQETEKIRKADFPNVIFEYIFIDDGSTDATLSLIRELRAANAHVRYISFSRNFGKEAAILAGLEAVQGGEFVTIMDADLQDPPSMLRRMYDIITEGDYDQVGMRRITRKGEPPIRSFCAKMFYKVINRISDIEMVDGARDFRLMKKYVADAILEMPEKCRYSKGIFSYVGFRTKWLPYENVERSAGESKWSFCQLLRYAIDGIISFSSFPLRLSGYTSALFLFIALILLIFALIQSSAVLAILTCGFFIGGVILAAVSILGRYMAQTYTETKRRPLYIIAETEGNAPVKGDL